MTPPPPGALTTPSPPETEAETEAAEAPEEPAGDRWCLGTHLVVWATRIWVVFVVLTFLLSGRWWLWLLPDLAPPLVFLAVPLLLLPFAYLARPVRRWLIPALVLLVLLGATQSGVNWRALLPTGGDGPVPAGSLNVFSWNTKYWDTADDPEAFYDYLHEADADVYLLQEYLAWEDGPTPIDKLERIRAEFPGYEMAVMGELVTLSRYPIVDQPVVGRAGEITAGTPWRQVYELGKILRTDVNVRGQVLSFYNVHIPVQLELEHSPLSGAFYDAVQARAAQRQDDYDALERDAAANPRPLLIAGDFNTRPGMGELRDLQESFDDAISVNDSLYPVSWNNETGMELWRLDWTFTNDGLNAERYALQDSRGMSDHRAQDIVVSLDGDG